MHNQKLADNLSYTTPQATARMKWNSVFVLPTLFLKLKPQLSLLQPTILQILTMCGFNVRYNHSVVFGGFTGLINSINTSSVLPGTNQSRYRQIHVMKFLASSTDLLSHMPTWTFLIHIATKLIENSSVFDEILNTTLIVLCWINCFID